MAHPLVIEDLRRILDEIEDKKNDPDAEVFVVVDGKRFKVVAVEYYEGSNDVDNVSCVNLEVEED